MLVTADISKNKNRIIITGEEGSAIYYATHQFKEFKIEDGILKMEMFKNGEYGHLWFDINNLSISSNIELSDSQILQELDLMLS